MRSLIVGRMAGAALVVACLLGVTPAAGAHGPHDVVSELAMSPDFVNDGTLFAAVTLTDNNLLLISRDAGHSWTYIGTDMAYKGVNQFAFSPDYANDGVAFATSSTSGVFRTTDRGLTWTPVDAGLSTLAINGLACSPAYANNHTLLCATTNGMFRSTDGGDSWAPYGTGLVESSIREVAWVKGDSPGVTIVYAAGKTFHRSLDDGATWTPTGSWTIPVESLAVSPVHSQSGRLAVSFGRFGGGVLLSNDAGLTFTQAATGLTDPNVEELAFGNDGSLFAVTDVAGCFRADTFGGAWTLLVDGFEVPSDLTNVHNTEVVVSPGFGTDHTVFVGSYEGVYRSLDRGDHWRQIDIYTPRLNRRFQASPDFAKDGTLLAGNYGGGVLRYQEHPPLPPAALSGSGPAGAGTLGNAAAGHGGPQTGPSGTAFQPAAPAISPFDWSARSDALTSPWSAVLSASDEPLGQRVLVNGYAAIWKTFDEGLTWTKVNVPAAVNIVRVLAFSPDYANDRTVFMGTGQAGAYVSHDAMASWQALSADIPFSFAASVGCFSPDFAHDRTAFLASRNMGIWRTQDGGAHWTHLVTGLTSSNFKSLKLSPAFPSDGTALAASFEQGVFRTTDRGSSWAPSVAGLPPGLLLAESLALAPGFPADPTVFVALQNNGVWKSLDGGLSWSPTGPGLAAPVAELEISPNYAKDRTVFAGTFAGTFVTRDAGASWQQLPGWVRADDTRLSVFYSPGTWTAKGSGVDFSGTYTMSTTPEAWSEYECYGDSVAWYAHCAPDGGLARVSVDGGPEVEVDTYAATDEPQKKVFERKFPELGAHLVRVVVTGTGSRASSGVKIRSDGFAYTF